MTVRSGEFVVEHLTKNRTGEPIDDDQIQPNGVDLTVGDLLRTSGTVHFYADAEGNDDGYDHGQRTRMRTFDPMGNTKSPFYRVYSGSYIIEYGEHITIPEGHVGLVKPRSRFMRSGMDITTAVWDQGYNGVGEGLLQVPQSLDCVHLPVGYPVAQLILVEADDSEAYDGSHQGEMPPTLFGSELEDAAEQDDEQTAATIEQ